MVTLVCLFCKNKSLNARDINYANYGKCDYYVRQVLFYFLERGRPKHKPLCLVGFIYFKHCCAYNDVLWLRVGNGEITLGLHTALIN